MTNTTHPHTATSPMPVHGSPLSSEACKRTKHSIAQINRKIAIAQKRAQKAAELAESAIVHEKAKLVRTGVKRTTFVSIRMSSQGFGDKHPSHCSDHTGERAARLYCETSCAEAETGVFEVARLLHHHPTVRPHNLVWPRGSEPTPGPHPSGT